MATHKLQERYHGNDLFFSTERTLSWINLFRGKKDLHPDLLAYEQHQALQRRPQWLRKVTKLLAF